MLKLRELEERDLKSINVWRNQEELISTLGSPFRFINIETDLKWYENYLKNRTNTVRCSIVDDEDDIILGLISLTNIDQFNQCGTLHIMIGNKENRGRGLGTFAINKLIEHAFENLNLRRIELSVLSKNENAINLYKKCGFFEEGLKKEAVYKNSVFQDLTLMAKLKEK